MDNHTDRVWALACPSSGTKADESAPFSLVSGGADSTITFWTDTTSSTYAAAVSADAERIEQDQTLENYIRAGEYREAITLALQLNHPGRLLSLFTKAIDEADGLSAPVNASPTKEATKRSLTGNAAIDAVLQSLDNENLYTLLLRIRDWNTNTHTSKVAQRLLYALVRSYPPSTFTKLVQIHERSSAGGDSADTLKDILTALSAYTDRHYRRMEQLINDSYLIDWILDEMDNGIGT